MSNGRDASVVLEDGRILEYWDGGDPAGHPVIYHPGTPVTRVMGRRGHDAAVAAGVRLVAVNRPGYGGSTTVRLPSLAAVGRDTVALARQLGMADFAVFGASGGGPYAVATALASGGAVRALGIVGGVGPWRELDAPDANPEDRACLRLLDAGDVDGAWRCFGSQIENERRSLSAEEFFEIVAGDDRSPVLGDPGYRALWIDSCRSILEKPDGYIYDNLAWGGTWDVDPREVAAPTLLLYGAADARCSPDGHGAWYAERIRGSELVVLPDATHFDVIDGQWPQVLDRLVPLANPVAD